MGPARRIARVARHALAVAAFAALAFCANAMAVPVLLSAGDTLELKRASSNSGLFITTYEFELSAPSSATYGVTRWRLAGRGIADFAATLYRDNEPAPLATGLDLIALSPMISNRFFESELDPGLYRLVISGDDSGYGYTGSLFISPPLAAFEALLTGTHVSEPAPVLLLLPAFVLLIRRRAARATRA